MNRNHTVSRKNNKKQRVGYISDSVRHSNEQVISGYFPKASSVKAMAIKKINNTLCGLLLCAIFVSAVSYYFVVSSEIKLNKYSRETTLLNVENAELQNKLDRLKSFNNVDLTMQKNNLLQKPEKVIEATVKTNPNTVKVKPKQNVKPTAWSLGY